MAVLSAARERRKKRACVVVWSLFSLLSFSLLSPSSSAITRHHRNDLALKTNPMDLPVRMNPLSIHKGCCRFRSAERRLGESNRDDVGSFIP